MACSLAQYACSPMAIVSISEGLVRCGVTLDPVNVSLERLPMIWVISFSVFRCPFAAEACTRLS